MGLRNRTLNLSSPWVEIPVHRNVGGGDLLDAVQRHQIFDDGLSVVWFKHSCVTPKKSLPSFFLTQKTLFRLYPGSHLKQWLLGRCSFWSQASYVINLFQQQKQPVNEKARSGFTKPGKTFVDRPLRAVAELLEVEVLPLSFLKGVMELT